MKSQLQSYFSLFTLTSLTALGLAASGCGARSTDATDTKTNWLSSCDEDSDCGNRLSCLCGVCTSSCDAKRDCTDLAGEARCLEVSHCGEVNAVCALSEDDLHPAPATTDDEGGTLHSSTSQSSPTSDPTQTTLPDENTAPSESTAPGESTAGNNETSSSQEASSTADAGVDTEGLCRDPSLYKARGETCQVIDFFCSETEVTFFDVCGCGCEPQPAACLDPNRTYLSTEVEYCQRAEPNCGPGTTQFSDECGCGCETLEVEGGAPETCPAAPDGTSVEVTVLAQAECFGDTFGQWATSQEELDAALAYCGLQVEASFDGSVVYVGVFPERLAARFGYAVVVEDTLQLGLESDAYCGGAAPPDSIIVLQLNGVSAELPVVTDYCTLGECSGLPVP
jgi:hypothetical protein